MPKSTEPRFPALVPQHQLPLSKPGGTLPFVEIYFGVLIGLALLLLL